MKIVTVIGARPQFIKDAPVARALADAGLREVMVHTGQHFDADMSDVFFEELGLAPPAHALGIAGGGHGAMTGRMLAALEEVLLAERPDWALVYGDTNSTLAGALAAAKLRVPVAHVEAGLRSFNMAMPEEVNRRLTDHCAALLLTPTKAADAHLAAEGIAGDRVRRVGDVMYDAARIFGAEVAQAPRALPRLDLEAGGYVLATLHRQENTDDPARLAACLGALARVARRMPVVLPLHPRTRAAAARHGLDGALGALTVTEPQGYFAMTELERGAAVIATDSGGVQKEAFFHRVPCVTLRDETEWTELIRAGWNRLAPPAEGEAALAAAILDARGRTGRDVEPYGDGRAAERIADALAAG